MALLEIIELSVNYGEIEALRGVSFSIEAGAVVALLGANGAGKSTTLRAVSGLVAPRSGSILLDGKPIAGLGPRAIVKLGVAHVPEGRRVFPGLTVRENIMLGASNSNASSSAIRRDADAMFSLFPDLRPFADALGWTLSGGQQQMVAVARGLMAKPRLLLLDEPSLGLAPVIMQGVFRIIAEINKRGTTVLLVEQNAHMALKVADWGYVLETGRLASGGDPATLWSDERIRDAYLGGAQSKAPT
ncbi:MAG TPA: ABC transporter ATP-binding protein [Roseiarcus sp.]|nr:ABC transporter ATP-binding protein [Roseiarcus sp.]